MLVKRVQIGLIHAAVAMTLVPLNSTLNRVMIKELALSAFLVAVLASLPYLFSPIQVAIGSFSDRNPIFGWRRTPYIVVGLVLCVVGLAVSPHIAYLLAENFWQGVFLGILAFGAWGMGYNLASVAYFALASEISGKEGRSRTIAVMFFMMIVAIIITSIDLSNQLEVYNPETLTTAFNGIAIVALILGLIGVIGVEPRNEKLSTQGKNHTWSEMWAVILKNKQATRFLLYLILLLTAILGQDILLEPYSAELFDLAVNESTRITSIWGTFFLLTLVIGGLLEKRVSKLTQARFSAWSAIAAFLLIIISGLLTNSILFYSGVVLLGAATGLSTVSNLSLMLDMTAPGQIGLYMGAWGMSSAIARLTGNLMGGFVRDQVYRASNNQALGYMVVFGLEIGMLIISLVILRQVDVNVFKQQATHELPYMERAAVAGEGS